MKRIIIIIAAAFITMSFSSSKNNETKTTETGLAALAPELKYKMVEKQEMLDLLLKYIVVESGSQETTDGSYPMTEGQRKMAKVLKEDIESVGVKATLSEWGYVYVDIPATVKEDVPVFGISCHLDYTPEAPGSGIRPSVITYNGGDIKLANGNNISPDSPEGEDLSSLIGKTLVVSDGNTLLGGDDKNGCAIAMSIIKTLARQEVRHGRIQVVFCPNEDIGMAADKIDTTLFNPDILFDVDEKGGKDIVTSNFTAYAKKVEFIGHEAHASEAKKRKYGDALAAAAAYISSVPIEYRPENTEGKEGYIHHWNLTNEGINYVVTSRIRFFDAKEGEMFMRIIGESLEKVRADFPNVEINTILDARQYDNVEYSSYPGSKEIISRAAARCGQEISFVSARGGTTAGMFTAKGLKGGYSIFSGQHNCHTVKEYSVIEEMMDSYTLLLYSIDEVSRL